MKNLKGKGENTRIVHAGRNPAANHGVVNPPVYHASTITFETMAELEASDRAPLDGTHYGRLGTPTTFALEEAVAALEGAERAVVLPSGLGALSVAFLSFVASGDHVLVSDNVYFPTRRLCSQLLARFGVEAEYYDPMIGAGIAARIRPNTRVVFVESPGSLTFEVQDVPAIAAAAHAAGALVMMDNTWSGGVFFKALAHGVDLSVQAGTKYIVGHSDAMLGTIALSDAHYATVKTTANNFGYGTAPDDCYLALRGLRTIDVRLRRHEANALAVANWLTTRPEVAAVLHPALPSCPGHAIWKRDFTGASGLFSIVLGDASKAAVTAMLDGLELFAMGYSWGGFESLIIPTRPATSRTATAWPHAGPSLRLHVGLEDPEDLIADLRRGFERLNAAR